MISAMETGKPQFVTGRSTLVRGGLLCTLVLLFVAPCAARGSGAAEKGRAALRPLESIHDFVGVCEAVRQDISSSGSKDLEKLREGLLQFTRGDYRSTAKTLENSSLRSNTAIGDYALYYRALALKSLNDKAGAERHWRQVLSEFPQSPLAAKAAVGLAETAMDQGDYQSAGFVLKGFRSARDPQVLLALAKACAGLKDYQAAGQLLEAVYFGFPLSDEARQAGTLLQSLRQAGKLRLDWDYARWATRIETLLADSRTASAYAESQRLPLPQQDPARSLVLLAKGKCSYLSNRISGAITLLKMVSPANPRVHAEALLYLALGYRKLSQFDRFVLNCQTLQNRYPDSPSTEEALFNLAGYYFLKERASEAFQILAWLAERFPGGAFASQGHWKLIWSDYLTGNYAKAIDGIFLHLNRFRESPYRRAALYWLGRSYEQLQDRESAGVVFEALVGSKPNDYYSLLAEKALKSFPPGSASRARGPADLRDSRLQEIAVLARPKPPSFPPGYTYDQQSIRRILELGAANLPQPALFELALLEEARGNDLAIQLLKAQMFAQAGDRWSAVKTLSRAIPQYFTMESDQLPRQIWEILYPLDYWKAIRTFSQKMQLDPLLVAAVIRQESLFNASARSKAQAMGLMQIIPPTGMRLARRLQTAFSASKLYSGEYNVRLGILHLSDLLGRYRGQIPQALAAYNAGEGRVDRWKEELPKESEEFVESIPFTETRDYVKRILTHWTHYRQLYTE